MMLVFLSMLFPSAAEVCVDNCDSAGISLLTLKTSVSYRAAITMWTNTAEKTRMINHAAVEQADIKKWSEENAALKRAVRAGLDDDKNDAKADAADLAPEDSPLVASAVDTKTGKTAQLRAEPTITPTPAMSEKEFTGPEDRETAKVIEAPVESAEREDWVKSLKEARDASRHLENTSELSKFIQAQQDSNMACHAKQLEAKRTLDGLATKVMLLSDEIEGQESVIAGQNKMVQDMLEQGSRSAESKKAEHHSCNVKYNESWDALQKYRDEIFELHNIAFPKFRSKIAHGALDHHINYTSEAEMHADHVRNYFQASYRNDEWESQVDVKSIREDREKYGIFDPTKYTAHGQYAETGMNGPDVYGAKDKAGRYMDEGGPSLQYKHRKYSLVDTGKHDHQKTEIDDGERILIPDDEDSAAEAFASKQVCKHLNAFMMKTVLEKRKQEPNYITTQEFMQLDCNQQREALQKTFGEAYTALMKVVELGEQEAEEAKQNCYGKAYAKDDQAQMSYQDKINKASAWIQAGKDVITVVLPILENARKEFSMLEDHIADLKKNCEVDDNVTSHLRSVRRLIEQLGNCPGRNDYKLIIPGKEETETTPNPFSSA
jgi:hypothetical protein